MRKLIGRPERGVRKRSLWRDPDMGRGRLSMAVLGLALVPALIGVLINTALVNEPDATVAAGRNQLTSAGAADLMVKEQRIEARLTALGANPDLARLAAGLPSPSDHVLAHQALTRLRGADGLIVTGACITRTSDARLTVLAEAGTAVPSQSSCATGDLLARAGRSEVGDVVRTHVPTPGGQRRLLVVTRMEGGAAVLAGEIDLAELFRQTPSASGEAHTALLVDGLSSDVVTGSSRPSAASASRRPLEPREVAVYVHGILTNHRPAIDNLAAAGWVTSVASLWPTVDGSELGLIHVWPKVDPGPSNAWLVAMLGLAAAGLIAALAFMRHLIRPFHELEESQAQLAVLYREAREDALHDGLTGMGNHRSYRDELVRQFELYERHGVPFTLMLIDLDNLKAVNDREGHAEGDRLLVGLSSTMREAFPPACRLFRIGGDEFAVLMPDTEPEEAVQHAGRLRHYCARPPAGERPLSFSGGISAVPLFAHDANQLNRQADVALYWAKRHGRGFFEVFDPERDEVPGESGPAGLDNAIYEIIRSRAFSPVYQPIVDLRTGAVIGFEGLVRPDPQGPFPDPHRLFAAAAATGRTVELDLAALEVVAAGASGISGDHLVSVNLSSKTLEVKDFDSAWLLTTLVRHGISPSRVILELTEREPISDVMRLQRNVHHLSQYGLRLAADDVGAGNAGLRLLSQVPFDIVKIDLSLVQEAARNTVTWAVLRSLRDFARRQDAIVIGEGVETHEQLRALRQLDIPVGQGYLLGMPQPRPDPSSVDFARLSALASGPAVTAADSDANPAPPAPERPIAPPRPRPHPLDLRHPPRAIPVAPA